MFYCTPLSLFETNLEIIDTYSVIRKTVQFPNCESTFEYICLESREGCATANLAVWHVRAYSQHRKRIKGAFTSWDRMENALNKLLCTV